MLHLITLFSAIGLILTGCINPSQHMSSVHSTSDRDLELGLMQTIIYLGMNQTEVSEVLGSPNLTSKDQNGDETWIYDKIASEASYFNNNQRIKGPLKPSSGLLLEGLTGTYSRESRAAPSSQQALTVVIKFDSQKKVKELSYHDSKF